MSYIPYYYPPVINSYPSVEPYMELYTTPSIISPYMNTYSYNMINPYNSNSSYLITSPYTYYLVASTAAALYSKK